SIGTDLQSLRSDAGSVGKGPVADDLGAVVSDTTALQKDAQAVGPSTDFSTWYPHLTKDLSAFSAATARLRSALQASG
ncbi:MAG: hypothetical protein ACRDYD_02535, partial [Acidimicrobiales bacterium]